jgi:hypothetical protein
VVLLGIIGLWADGGLRVKTREGTPVVKANVPNPDGSEPGPSDDRLVGKWVSVGTPTRITQEFSKDGESKITFSGTTHLGTYKFNGDEIDWRSGSTTAKCKVRFNSSIEMVLSNEAGTVKYRKAGSPQPAPKGGGRSRRK